jgi:tRNA-dihydrouridine synthase B
MEKKKFTKIGNVDIGNGIFLAPMEDVCDIPFRVICKRLGADIVYSEFIASEGIVRDSRRSKQKMRIAEDERPVAIQIFGGSIEAMVESAKIVEDSGTDILDINFGCWVKKVVQRDAGAAFLKKPDEMAELTRRVQEAVQIPVTVKTRLGWDQDSIAITEVAKKIEQAGAKALAIHCRTRDMGMTGVADWSWIPKIKDVVNIPIILNGDVVDPEDVKTAFETTGCDALMIGRGCIGYPFIFQRAKVMMEEGYDPGEPDIYTRVDVCLEHLKMSIEYKEKKAVIEFRKHYSGYLKGFHGASEIRSALMKCENYEQVEDNLRQYVKYLEDNDKLEAVSKTRKAPNLSCNSEKYVKRQTRDVV